MVKEIRDSGKYRTPTEHEVSEIIRLRRLIDEAGRDDDPVAKERASEALRRLIATMEKK